MRHVTDKDVFWAILRRVISMVVFRCFSDRLLLSRPTTKAAMASVRARALMHKAAVTLLRGPVQIQKRLALRISARNFSEKAGKGVEIAKRSAKTRLMNGVIATSFTAGVGLFYAGIWYSNIKYDIEEMQGIPYGSHTLDFLFFFLYSESSVSNCSKGGCGCVLVCVYVCVCVCY